MHTRLLGAAAIMAMAVGILPGCGVPPIEDLSRKVESPKVVTREQAIVDLANLRDRRAIELLTEVLSGDEELYDKAAVALVKQGRQIEVTAQENPVAEQVSKVLENTYLAEQFRARAAWTLGEIGDRRAIPILKEAAFASLADATKPIMKQQAAEALEKLGFNSAGRAYELPMGTLTDDLELIPDILPMQPPA